MALIKEQDRGRGGWLAGSNEKADGKTEGSKHVKWGKRGPNKNQSGS